MTVGKYPPVVYTEQEQKRLAEFRKRIADLELTAEQLHDSQLIRWIRARNFDLGKAYDMLKKHLQWRKEYKIDGILERGEDVPEIIKQTSPFAFCGIDKDGYPILLVPMGRQDMRARLEEYGPEACQKFNHITSAKLMKLLQDIGEEQGRPVTQFVEIIDLEGYSYRQLTSKLCRDFWAKMQTEFDANYPEMLRYGLIINAPKIFHIFFRMLKPFISKQTLEKIDVYGPDPEKWKKVVSERFPVEMIPPHWGGTRVGGDEYCSQSEIWMQGPVSSSFFIDGTVSSRSSSLLCEDENLTFVTINARDQLKLEFLVTKPNCSICWRFRTEGYDIGFEIVSEKSPPNTSILQYKRTESQIRVEEGSVPCEMLGKYTVIFDNSYSWTTAKNLKYNVCILDADEDLSCSSGENDLVAAT